MASLQEGKKWIAVSNQNFCLRVAESDTAQGSDYNPGL